MLAKRAAIVGLMFTVSIVGPGRADDLTVAIKGLTDAVFSNMAGAYVCRFALGGDAYYRAAITIAESSLIAAGASNDDAVLAVDRMARKFEADPRAAQDPGLSDEDCLSVTDAKIHEIEVWRARLNKARAANSGK